MHLAEHGLDAEENDPAGRGPCALSARRRFPALPVFIRVHLWLFLCLVNLLSAGCGPKAVRFDYTEVHMGVPATISVYAADEPTARVAVRAAFDRIAHLDSVMSDYREDSELMRLVAKAGADPVRISPALYQALEESLHFAALSEGAFDPTIGPLVELWRLARKFKQMPTDDSLSDARRWVDWRDLRLDASERTAQLAHPRMKLDLGGIGKGIAADQAYEVLAGRGLSRAMVNIGGDLRVGDPPPGRSRWTVQVQAGSGIPPSTVHLINAAVATSGDAFQFVELDGVRYSHIVDPRTGLGLTDRIAVTVVAPNATMADALASIVSVLGPDQAKPLLGQFDGVRVTTARPGEQPVSFGVGYDGGFTLGGN